MYELADKRVLLAGNDVTVASTIAKALKSQGAVVSQSQCVVAADYASLAIESADLIVITQLYDPGTHKAFLCELNQEHSRRIIPVLILVDLEHDDVQQVLSTGATDFIDIHDSIEAIIEKIELSFSQNDTSATHTTIDITPKAVPVAKPGASVYVVEDDPLLRNLLREKFAKSGLRAEFSVNGHAIIDHLISFKPDVLILDLMLPGKNGLDILKELKANEKTAHIPVIVFSNRDSQADRQRAQQLGAAAFYVKAMTDLSELVELIEQHTK